MGQEKWFSRNVGKAAGVISILYIILELFLYPYMKELSSVAYIPYDYYFRISIRAAGILAVAVWIVSILRSRKMLQSRSRKLFAVVGIGLYLVFYGILLLYLAAGLDFALGRMVFHISYQYPALLWCPAVLVALGLPMV